jgi:hypothetical protein
MFFWLAGEVCMAKGNYFLYYIDPAEAKFSHDISAF